MPQTQMYMCYVHVHLKICNLAYEQKYEEILIFKSVLVFVFNLLSNESRAVLLFMRNADIMLAGVTIFKTLILP